MESLTTVPHFRRSAVEFSPTLAPYRESIEQLRAVGQMFHARGWSLGTSSNYSIVQCHDPLRLLITASGRDKGALEPTDFVVVDGHGRPIDADQPKSSAETLLHCLLAEDSQVGAVLHTHSVWGTVLSDLYAHQNGFVIEDFEMLKGFEGITSHEQSVWIDIFDNSQDIPALVQNVRQRFAETDRQAYGFLLRQHGLYTWGKDLFATRRHVEIFEFLFECVARKLMLKSSLCSQ